MSSNQETLGCLPYFRQCWTEALTKQELVYDKSYLECCSWHGRGWSLFGTAVCAMAIPFSPFLYGVGGIALYCGPSPDNKPRPLKDSRVLAVLDVVALVLTSPVMMVARMVRCLMAALLHPGILFMLPPKDPPVKLPPKPQPVKETPAVDPTKVNAAAEVTSKTNPATAVQQAPSAVDTQPKAPASNVATAVAAPTST